MNGRTGLGTRLRTRITATALALVMLGIPGSVFSELGAVHNEGRQGIESEEQIFEIADATEPDTANEDNQHGIENDEPISVIDDAAESGITEEEPDA
ncbi:MAG: hypothetical protein FWD25_12695, partial [Clostridia bacterium]|nr:hypothetical protein [Clostridia bacterium]